MDEPRSWTPEVRISADGMKALVILPEPKDIQPSVDAVITALLDAGVTVGIDRGAISEAVFSGRWKQPVVVARGIPPVHGLDSSVKYLFKADKPHRPRELDDGSVDFKNLDLIENVRKDQELAIRIPPVPGTDGMSVRGETVRARQGRILPLPAGKNTKVTEDDSRIVALIDGQATIDRDGYVHVYPVYLVRGDVGVATGNIKFVGSVVVQGAVAPGFKVEAEGNIEVRGLAAGDELVAGGHIIAGRGIQGRGKGRVKAGGDISAAFVENATIECGGVMSVRDAIMHSRVSAKIKIDVTSGKGVIVGGLVRAGEEVSAKCIGSSFGTPTEIEVGVDPDIRESHLHVLQDLKEKESELERIDQAINVLKARMMTLGPSVVDHDKKAGLLRLVEHRTALMREIDSLRNRRDQLEEHLRKSRRGRVRCDVLFPGVRITIGTVSMQVTDEWYNVIVYLAEDGKMAIPNK